jgi:hypothetical protein
LYRTKISDIPNHKDLFKFLNLIIEYSSSSKASDVEQIYFHELFSLLPEIFPCNVCRENISLLIPEKKDINTSEPESRISMLWRDIAIPLIRAHKHPNPSRVFKYTGFLSQNGANFTRFGVVGNKNMEITNTMGRKIAGIYRPLPVIADKTYTVSITGVRFSRTPVFISVFQEDGKILPIQSSMTTYRYVNEALFPKNGSATYSFQPVRTDSSYLTVKFLMFFSNGSRKSDKFILQDFSVRKETNEEEKETSENQI